MRGRVTEGRHNEAFRRLAVVMLTLASIAETIAGRSAPFRGIVLWLLRRAEVRARDLVSRSDAGALLASASVESPVCLLGGAGEAARLAHMFRVLAALFFELSRQAGQLLRMARRYNSACPLADHGTLREDGLRHGARHPACIDTS
jgi:hypothetical protein